MQTQVPSVSSSTLSPDIAYDYGLLPPSSAVVFEQGNDGEGVLDLQCDQGADRARLLAWCRLVAQKGVWSPGGVYDPHACIPTTKPDSRVCVLFGVPAMTAPRHDFHPSDLCDEAAVKIRGFMDPRKSFLHAFHEAWVLAGIEVAAADQKACTSDVFCRATAHRCAVAMCLQQRVAHVMRYAPWVGINVPVPGPPGRGQGTPIDFLFMARDGLLHACIVNVEGSAIRTGRQDVLTGLVRISGLEDVVHVSSLRVLYPLSNESVLVDTSAWRPAALATVLRTGMRAWNPDQHAVFVYCTAGTAQLQRVGGDDDAAGCDPFCVTLATTDDLWDTAAGRRIVAWRYTDFAGNDRRFDNDVFELDVTETDALMAPTCAAGVRQAYVKGHHALHTVGFMRAARTTVPECTPSRPQRD